MEYPIKLAEHKTPQYHFNDFVVKERKSTCSAFSFYHEKRYLPLLMHDHDFYEINIIVDGEGMHYIGNNRFFARKGSVFVIPPYVKHGYFSHSDLSIFNIDLSNVFMKKYKTELFSLAGYSMLFEIEPSLRENFTDAFLLRLNEKELADAKVYIDDLAKNELYSYKGINVIREASTLAFVGNLIKTAYEKNQKNDFKQNEVHNSDITISLVKSVEYVHENYGERLSVDELAKLCATSKITYIRYFKKLFNSTPYDYILKYRIKMAKNLIVSTDKTLSFIAQEVGFFDLSHFERYFFKFENCSPSQYRAKIEKQ